MTLIRSNSLRIPPMSIHQITCVGIQPQQQKILVAKGAVAPRAAYEPVSARIIEVDSAGATFHQPPTPGVCAGAQRVVRVDGGEVILKKLQPAGTGHEPAYLLAQSVR